MLNEDVIVEIDYVFSFLRVVVHEHVHVIYSFLVFEQVTVLSDYLIECNLHSWLHLAYTIYCAHDHLIDHSVH